MSKDGAIQTAFDRSAAFFIAFVCANSLLAGIGWLINQPILAATIGVASWDISFASNNTSVRFSQNGLDTVLHSLDPNYIPPTVNVNGQSVGVYSIQYL